MDLKKVWSYDECRDCDELFDKLDELQDEGKISWDKTDGWIFYIEDLEMDSQDEKELLKLFDELDVYPSDDDDLDIGPNWEDGWEDY
jgi:hypothetical protein